MNNAQKLAEVLKRLNQGEDPVVAKSEAQEFLSSINPADLSLAEQSLLDAGLSPEDLRRLCAVHMEVLDEQQDRAKAGLRPGHVIHTLVSEHEMILGFLDELEKVSQDIRALDVLAPDQPQLIKLADIAEHLVHAEPHHQREEEVLFPELEQRGVFGPPQIMRLEHQDLRKDKKGLKELSETVPHLEPPEFKRRLDALSSSIVGTLRDHIFKENNILYPTALQVIQDERVWQEMKKRCDSIGYCCFTPSEEAEVHTLDLRSLPPFVRHQRIFEVWGSLEPGESLKLINDHDPKPLHYQFEAEYQGQYAWEYEQKGPVDWIVTIKKV